MSIESDIYRRAIIELNNLATFGKRKTIDKKVVREITERAYEAGNAASRRVKEKTNPSE